MNGAIFRAYVAQFLARELASGDIVVMDNLASHKSDAVRETIEKAGAELVRRFRLTPAALLARSQSD